MKLNSNKNSKLLLAIFNLIIQNHKSTSTKD